MDIRGMYSRLWPGRRLLLAAAMSTALVACNGNDGGSGPTTNSSSAQSQESEGGSTFGGLLNAITPDAETLVGSGVLPSMLAIAEETCVAQQVIAGNTDGLGGQIAMNIGFKIVQQTIEDETGRKPMFCEQNMVALLLTTDKLMGRSIKEVASGIEIANRALGGKVVDLPDTLALYLSGERRSLSSMQTSEIESTLTLVGETSAKLQAEIEARIQQGGLSDETIAQLLQAVQHLSNAAYIRGKLMVAGFVIKRALSFGNPQTFALLFQKQTSIPEGFLEDLPSNTVGMVDATFKTFELISLISDVKDDDAFETAFDQVKKADDAVLAEISAEAASIQAANNDEGGPTVAEASEAGFGTLLTGS